MLPGPERMLPRLQQILKRLAPGAEQMLPRLQQIDTCMVFVKKYDGGATKEEILELFPMYANVIDMVLRLQHTPGA
jgi:hypothetical protein